MATLEELLGISKNEVPVQFPSYEEMNNRAFANSVRERDNSYSAYSAPQTNYYEDRAYAPVHSIVEQRGYDVRRMQEPPAQADDRQYGYQNYRSYANPAYQTEDRRKNLYEYARGDNDFPSERELMDRLSAGSTAVLPREHVQENLQRTSEFHPVKGNVKSESAKKARLNLKAKILFGVYLAVIVVVAVLVIVNADNLNNGRATTPSSSYAVADAAHISEETAINYSYGAQDFIIK